MSRASLTLSVLAVSLGLAACVSNGGPTVLPPGQVVLESGRHLRILSAYLSAGDGPAVVQGQVRRQTSWVGASRGHLHVTAFGSSGEVVARRTVRWSSGPGGRHPAPSTYRVGLGVPKTLVSGLKVAFAAESHPPMEGFQ